MAAMLGAKDRIREATRAHLEGLTEKQLNTTLAKRPVDWGGARYYDPTTGGFLSEDPINFRSGVNFLQVRLQPFNNPS